MFKWIRVLSIRRIVTWMWKVTALYSVQLSTIVIHQAAPAWFFYFAFVFVSFCTFVFLYFFHCVAAVEPSTPLTPLIVYFLPDPNPIPGGTTRASPPLCCYLCERKTYMLLLAKLYGLVFTHNTTSAFGSPEKENQWSFYQKQITSD